MDYLTLCQTLRRECRIPGSGPSTVVDQVGDLADVVAWVSDAYLDIQNDCAGAWRWLRRRFTFQTTANVTGYAYGDVNDEAAATAITRFNAWDIHSRQRAPSIYLTSAGQATESWLGPVSRTGWASQYDFGTHVAAKPFCIAINDDDSLLLGPKPDDAYTVRGWYFRGPQILAADDDEPEMPAAFHRLIVWRAMRDYGYNDVAQELIDRAVTHYNEMWGQLVAQQLVTLDDVTLAGPLA